MELHAPLRVVGLGSIALLFLTTAATGSSRSVAETGDSFGDATNSCADQGVDWQDPQVVAVGPDACSSTDLFDLEIGADAQGQPVTIANTGCPSWITVDPGRWVRGGHKVGFETFKAQDLTYEVKNFECAGQPFSSYCLKLEDTNDPTPVADMGERICEDLGGMSL